MGRAKHKEWDGFTAIYDKNSKIIQAMCNKCHKKFVKRDSAHLREHRYVKKYV